MYDTARFYYALRCAVAASDECILVYTLALQTRVLFLVPGVFVLSGEWYKLVACAQQLCLAAL